MIEITEEISNAVAALKRENHNIDGFKADLKFLYGELRYVESGIITDEQVKIITERESGYRMPDDAEIDELRELRCLYEREIACAMLDLVEERRERKATLRELQRVCVF